MQAETVAHASIGCWSKVAGDSPRRKNPWQPIGWKQPFGERCTPHSHCRDRKPISDASLLSVHWPLRIKAWGKRAFAYETTFSNHGQSSAEFARNKSIRRPVSKSRAWLTRRSPLSRRRYSWIPMSAYAQQRGEPVSKTAFSARSKWFTAHA